MNAPTNGSNAARRPDVMIRRVKLRNYKSIPFCDVELRPFTVLVGRNGSGKSNFLDALAFVAAALGDGFGVAVGRRGSFANTLRYLGADDAQTISIELTLELGSSSRAVYSLEICDPHTNGRYRQREWLGLSDSSGLLLTFRVEGDELVDWETRADFELPFAPGKELPRSLLPRVAGDRPYLGAVAAFLPHVRTISAVIEGIVFYDLHPAGMRGAFYGDDDSRLHPDGGNVVGLLARIQGERPQAMSRITGYLHSIVPGIEEIRCETINSYFMLFFHHSAAGKGWKLPAAVMSDGTLRSLATLVALWQQPRWGAPIRLIVIEEPETSLHPAAAAVLMDAFHEASVTRQVLITTHSPDLLDCLVFDSETFEPDQLLAVETDGRGTRIGPIDRASVEIIREKLSTSGGLLRGDQIEVDWRDVERQVQATSAVDA